MVQQRSIGTTLHNLSPIPTSKHRSKRVGRGEGSKKGGTAGKGHKGAQSRSGYKTRPHFEGGQTPLQRRTPKWGRSGPKNKPKTTIIKTSLLAKFSKTLQTAEITEELLVQHGAIKQGKPYKILYDVALDKKLNIHATACSARAKAAIEAQGGKIIIIS